MEGTKYPPTVLKNAGIAFQNANSISIQLQLNDPARKNQYSLTDEERATVLKTLEEGGAPKLVLLDRNKPTKSGAKTYWVKVEIAV